MANYYNWNPDDIGLAANPEPEEPVWADDEDDDIVGYCDNCDEPIREGDYAFGIVHKAISGKYRPICLCKDCETQMSLGDLMDLLGIYYTSDHSERVLNYTREHAKKMNDIAKSEWRSTITTAASLKKGVSV